MEKYEELKEYVIKMAQENVEEIETLEENYNNNTISMAEYYENSETLENYGIVYAEIIRKINQIDKKVEEIEVEENEEA